MFVFVVAVFFALRSEKQKRHAVYTCIYGDQIARSRVLYPSLDAVLQYTDVLSWITRLTTKTMMYVLHLYVHYVTN